MTNRSYKPKIAIKHHNVAIYHTYRNDDLNEPRTYWYGYTKDCNDDGKDSFDIRDLPNYTNDKEHTDILKEAIEKGFIVKAGVNC